VSGAASITGFEVRWEDDLGWSVVAVPPAVDRCGAKAVGSARPNFFGRTNLTYW
jgi:hypothetical protein